MITSDIVKRLESIETRLFLIENSFREANQPLPDFTTAKQSYEPDTVSNASSTKIQGNLLGIVAVICFVLAGGFIIKLYVASGWLTHERQIGLAALLGFALIFSRNVLTTLDKEYVSLLPASGIIVLYLTTFAAHIYYSLISFEMAISIVCIVSALCIRLYMQIKHDIYAITAAIGAYISPLIMNHYPHTNKPFILYYFLLCSITFSLISIRVGSRTLTVVSSYLAILLTALAGIDLGKNMLVAILLAVHFMVFSWGTYWYSRLNHISLSRKEAWAFFPVLFIFYSTEYYFIENIQPGLAPWVSLSFAGILIGLYLSAKKYLPNSVGSEYLVFAFTTLICFHSLYLELLPTLLRPWTFVVIALGVTFYPFNISVSNKISKFSIPIFGITLVCTIEYMSMIYNLFYKTNISIDLLIVSFASCASIWAVIINIYNKVDEPDKYHNFVLSAAHLLAILGLWHLTRSNNSLAVSASWLMYAVCVMAFAYSRKDAVMAKSAIWVLTLASGKALLYDASEAATIIRTLCLLLTGIVLYGCGLIIRRTDKWVHVEGENKNIQSLSEI